jgi:TolB-like protein/Tfp pilus assembly protein PilF
VTEGAGDGSGPATGVKPSDQSAPASPRKATVGELITELKRRRVFRALIGYAIFSFAVLQVAEPVLHGLGLGDHWLRGLLIALGTGLPVTALASWTFDLTRRGVHRTESGPDVPGGRTAWVRVAALIGSAALGAALATGAWLGLAQQNGPGEGVRPAAKPVTLAILPLSNLSGDASQEYFSDGMTEEMAGKLSPLRGASVTAGSSVAKYRGTDKGAREIGKELGVTYLLEGSVRRSGDRIRVSANLVTTADGVQAWTETMDARLNDVFEVQERVASRIADALRLRLSPEEAHALGDWGTRDAAAYDEFLRGQALVEHHGNREQLESARGHFARAVELDPRFAPAFAGLANAEAEIYRNFDSSPGRLSQAEAHVQRALEIDPGLVRALFSAGLLRGVRYDYTGAAERFQQVVALEPQNYMGWDYLCWALGYPTPPPVQEAERACRASIAINPGLELAHYHLARVLLVQGRIDEAQREIDYIAEHAPTSFLVHGGRFWIAMASRRPREALASLDRADQLKQTANGRAWTAMALGQLGLLDEVLAALDQGLAGRYRDESDLRSNPYFEPLRQDPRFRRMLDRYGIEPGGNP